MADHAVEVIAAVEAGRTPEPFTYRDHGALVSLSRFATVGSLMGNLAGGRVAIEGRLARAAYLSLYRLHIISMHGWLRGLARLAAKQLGRAVRPQIKLH